MSLVAAAVVLVLWVALWGGVSTANVLSGLLVVAALAVVVRPLRGARQWRHHVHPLGLVRFLVWFAWALVKANLAIAWEIIRPGSRIAPGIVAVPLASSSPVFMTVVADAVTLTPGTLSIEVRHEPATLYVHALLASDPEAVRRELDDLQARVLRAFTPERVSS